ncbi:MAG: hypothetical protein LC804_13470 [Acidobacteria bacterium]|nr:hypothetical protein [Acidobacteriota bacterium]
MKRLALMVCALAVAAPALAQDASGRWDLVVTTPNGQNQAVLMLKKDGEKLSGTVARGTGDSIPVAGTQKGADVVVSFSVPSQNGAVAVTLKGRQDGESMKGSAELSERGQAEWSAARTAAPAAAPSGTSATDVTGTWAFQVVTDAGTRTPTVVLKQDGEKLSGLYKSQLGEAPLTGTIKDRDFSFQVTLTLEGNPIRLDYSGTVEQNGMSGRVTVGDLGAGTFTAKKQESGG